MTICLHKLLSDLTVFFHPMLHSFIWFLTFSYIETVDFFLSTNQAVELLRCV